MTVRWLRGGTALLVVLLAAAALLPGRALAQTSARAFVTPGTTVGVGATFVLSVEITGAQGADRDPGVPDLSGFARYLGSGSSRSVQTVNGRTTVSTTLQYRFQTLEEGRFTIPPLTLRVNGQDLTTDPIPLTVSADAPPDPTGGGTGVSPDDLFLTAEASSTRVREGEPVVVEYRIWTRVDVTSYTLTDLPEMEGLWVEEIPQDGPAPTEQRVRDGEQYTSAVLRRVVVVPTGPGTRTLEPLGLEVQVRVRRRSNDPFDRVFGGGLFGGRMEPMPLRSNPLTLTVEPLPPGRPEPFSGIVGSLRVASSLDRDTVDANQAVTLTVRVEGTGNVRTLPEPAVEFPADFEVFPPEVSESVDVSVDGIRGGRTFTYVLIPRAPGDRTVPAVRYGYFDEGAGAYRTAEAPPIPLTVTGTVADGPAGAARGGVTQLRQDIRFIHLGPAGLRPVSGGPPGGPLFWAVFLLPMVAVAGAAALVRHRERLEVDVAYARGRKAGRVAKKRFAEARRLARGDDPRAFYAEVARALRGFVADKLNLHEAGMSRQDLREGLRRQGVDDGVVHRVVACLDHCDRQRFAPPTSNRGEMGRFLDDAASLMTDLDRGIR